MGSVVAVREIMGEDRTVVLVDDGKFVVPFSAALLDNGEEAVIAMAEKLVEHERHSG